jgi:hypothetical protein
LGKLLEGQQYESRLLDRATALPWRVGFGVTAEDIPNEENRRRFQEDDRHYITSEDDAAPVVVRGADDSWGIPQGVVSEADAELIVYAVNKLWRESMFPDEWDGDPGMG